jgi:hypothetical protein
MIQKIPVEGLWGISFSPEAFHEISNACKYGEGGGNSDY